jgi:redox-sensitive bicupin YhaK (pirin superfamily)
VQLKRVFGGGDLFRFDPFLMLDEFGSDKPDDYIGGFPSHPHRGFETVSYMLEGKMEHRDHMGNVGQLGPGDVQWMKAGSGVIHSEMPKQEQGRMRGFQLWVNLPANEKMTPPTYNDIAADDVPVYKTGQVVIKSIAGKLRTDGIELFGAVSGLTTDPAYLDLSFVEADEIEILVPDGYTALVYVYEGSAYVGDSEYQLGKSKLARLSTHGMLRIKAVAASRILLMTGKPIGEPIVQRGPFVMNSVEEIQQAIRDYSEGTLVQSSSE